MNSIPLITLNQFGLVLLGIGIMLTALVLLVYVINELRAMRANQRKLLATFGLDEEDLTEVEEVPYRRSQA